ncbi:MAG: carotenoid 1,2-hydratase [Oceanicaulis sp.]
MFSPYYAWAGRRAPMDHCALNVCLYARGKTRWAMTERGAGAVSVSADRFRVGPSQVRFEDGALIYDIDERGAPLPYPVRGRVVFSPQVVQQEGFALDAAGRHVWRPIWPRARVEAHFDRPGVSFKGAGYVDMNAGTEPLEAGFASWNWARASSKDGAIILYDSVWRSGGGSNLALEIGADGAARRFKAPPTAGLPNVGWGVARATRAETGARVVKTLEDTPFYSRSLVESDCLGAPRTFMHESLDLDRFASGWVKTLLPFRMPRRFWL